jgi:hypothetical protein
MKRMLLLGFAFLFLAANEAQGQATHIERFTQHEDSAEVCTKRGNQTRCEWFGLEPWDTVRIEVPMPPETVPVYDTVPDPATEAALAECQNALGICQADLAAALRALDSLSSLPPVPPDTVEVPGPTPPPDTVIVEVPSPPDTVIVPCECDTIPVPPDTLPPPIDSLSSVVATVQEIRPDSFDLDVSWDSDGLHTVRLCCRDGGGGTPGSPYPPDQTVDGSLAHFTMGNLPLPGANASACVLQQATGIERCDTFPVPGLDSVPPIPPDTTPPIPPDTIPPGDAAWPLGTNPYAGSGILVYVGVGVTRVDWSVAYHPDTSPTPTGFEVLYPGGSLETDMGWVDLPVMLSLGDEVCVAPGSVGGPYDRSQEVCGSYR